MTNFLNENDKHAILIGIGGRKWDHWSVVKSISPGQIRFFDSYELKQLNNKSCTTKKWTKARPNIIVPTETYFISG